MIYIKEALSANEVDTLSKVAREIWEEYFPFILEEDQIDYMLEKFLSRNALMDQLQEGYEFYFAMSEDNQILGFFVIHPEEEKLFLSKIYLYKDNRGLGTASEMFDFIEQRAKEEGLNKIYLTVNKYNKNPINIYKHRGFTIADSVVTDIGNNFVMDDYIMEKSL